METVYDTLKMLSFLQKKKKRPLLTLERRKQIAKLDFWLITCQPEFISLTTAIFKQTKLDHLVFK